MEFRVVESALAPSNGHEVLLVRDNWNDRFTWVTQFFGIVVTEKNQRVVIGQVKIGRAGMGAAFSMTYEPTGRGFDSCQPHKTSQRVSFRSHKDQGASPIGFVTPQALANSA